MPAKSKGGAVADTKTTFSHVFHPEIDYKRFMDVSIPVVNYIMENKELFKKPYIAIFAQHESDYSLSCFISVNAGLNGSSEEEQSSSKEEQESVDSRPPPTCGYLQFNGDATGTNG